MREDVIVSTEVLIDDSLARAAVVAWAAEAYPAVTTGAVAVDSLLPRVQDPFLSDEALTTALLCEALRAPPALVEPSLVARLVRERRYGGGLYRDVFDVPTLYWTGPGALESVLPRAYALPSTESVVVVSPRERLEVMTTLLSTGWAERVSGVVSGDDLEESVDLATGLLEVAMGRLRRAHGADVRVRIHSNAPSWSAAAESLGIVEG